MAKQLTSIERAQIVVLLEQEIHPVEVAKIFGVHRTSIDRTKLKHEKFKTFNHFGCNGRPKKLSTDLLKDIDKEIQKIQKIHYAKLRKRSKKQKD